MDDKVTAPRTGRSANYKATWVSVEELAAEQNRHVRTIRRWIRDGKMPPSEKHGRKAVFRRSEVAACLAGHVINQEESEKAEAHDVRMRAELVQASASETC